MNLTIPTSQTQRSPRRLWLRGALLIVVIGIILALLIAFQSASHPALSTPVNVITAQTLEEHYGLRVNLIAATAAGGLVDVRLKVLDVDKAKALLSDPKNFPTLKVADSDITLATSEEMRLQALEAVDGGLIVILYSNRGSAVHPNSAVAVQFGDMQLEPIVAH